MAEKTVTLPSDSGNTGKAMRLVENTIGANLVEQEVVTLADAAGNLLLGQKAQAGSLPVTIASDQATFPVTVTFPGNQVVSGTVTANQGGAPWSITFSTPQHIIIDSGSTVVTQAAGSNLHANIDNFPASQVVDDSSTSQILIDIERGNQSRLDTLIMMFAAVFSPNADLGGLMANTNRAQVMTN